MTQIPKLERMAKTISSLRESDIDIIAGLVHVTFEPSAWKELNKEFNSLYAHIYKNKPHLIIGLEFEGISFNCKEGAY